MGHRGNDISGAGLPRSARMISILIVEDHAATRRSVRRALMTMFGRSEIVEADNASSAVDALRSRSFSLVICDYDLGGSYGGQVLDFIKIHRPEMVDRFVFFTGAADDVETVHHKVIDKGDALEFSARLLSLIADLPDVAIAQDADRS